MRELKHHATSDQIFDSEETEFLKAMDEYRRRTGKRFPTLTETLNVVKSLGYVRRPAATVGMDAVFASP